MIALRFIIIFLLLFAAVVFIVLELYKFFISIQNSDSSIKNDQENITNDILKERSYLAPLEMDELELLSMGLEYQVKKGLNTTVSGIINNIYHEPVVSFSYKAYQGSKIRNRMVAVTSEDKIEISQNNDSLIFQLNDVDELELTEEGWLKSKDNISNLQLDKNPQLSHFTILKEGTEIAFLRNPTVQDSENNRAIQMLSNKITDKEAKMILSLAIWNSVSNKL